MPVVVSSVPPITPFKRVLTLGVQHGHKVGTIIHRDLRLVIDGRENVTVIGVVVLALDGKDGNVVIAHQAGGDVVLRGERIGGAQHHIGASIAQTNREVRSLGGHVQASGNPNALQRLVLDEFLADDLQNFHRLVGPVNPLLAQIGQVQILHVTIHLRRCGCHASPVT